MSRQEIPREGLADSTVVVLDILLATTTLTTILESGARRVFPVASLEEAEEVCDRLDPAETVRGGEQNARRIDGYDCGPYPEEFTPEVVGGRDVVFVTTNGTRALGEAAGAGELLIASLRNAPAVARYLNDSAPESVYVVCAGSQGRFVLDDFVGAATLLQYMKPEAAGWRLNDAAKLAREFVETGADWTIEALKRSRSGGWFELNDRLRTLEFVAAVGVSDRVARVESGVLREVETGETDEGETDRRGETDEGETDALEREREG